VLFVSPFSVVSILLVVVVVSVQMASLSHHWLRSLSSVLLLVVLVPVVTVMAEVQFGSNPYYYAHWCGTDKALTYLVDGQCQKKFPSAFDRDAACPNLYTGTLPPGYAIALADRTRGEEWSRGERRGEERGGEGERERRERGREERRMSSSGPTPLVDSRRGGGGG